MPQLQFPHLPSRPLKPYTFPSCLLPVAEALRSHSQQPTLRGKLKLAGIWFEGVDCMKGLLRVSSLLILVGRV